MFKRILTGLALAATTLAVAAAPTTEQYATDTTAVANGVADVRSDTSPPGAMPLVTSASVVGTTDFAAGSGIAAQGLLTASAEADSVSDFASATGSAHYVATFGGGGLMRIHLDFSSFDTTDAAAFSIGSAYLLVTSDGTTLLDEAITAPSIHDWTLTLTGANQTFDLMVTSEGNAFGASAFNSASATFDVSVVPEPPACALMLAGFGVLAWRGRRRVACRV